MYVKKPPTPGQQRATVARKQTQAIGRGQRQLEKAARDNVRAASAALKQRRRSTPRVKSIRVSKAETGALLVVFGWLVTKKLFWILVAVCIILGLMR